MLPGSFINQYFCDLQSKQATEIIQNKSGIINQKIFTAFHGVIYFSK